jgi:hypothetical protein
MFNEMPVSATVSRRMQNPGSASLPAMTSLPTEGVGSEVLWTRVWGGQDAKGDRGETGCDFARDNLRLSR